MIVTLAAHDVHPALSLINFIETDEGNKYAPACHMAAAIINITETQGDCSPQDLHAKGFSRDETKTYFHMAQSLASVELKLMSQSRITRPSRR